MEIFRGLCDELGFPAEATEYILSCLSEVGEDAFAEAVRLYVDGDGEEYDAPLDAISAGSGIHRYTVDLMMLLAALKAMPDRYAERGYSREIFTDTFKDITYKLHECRKLHGIWGVFVVKWFRKHFKLELFALGRLQYEEFIADFDYEDIISEGDKILTCHIPASGPMTDAMVEDSLSKAYDFYGYEGDMIVRCSSWLLYPPYYALYPEGSNLRNFFDRFTNVRNYICGEDPWRTKWHDLWRVFYKKTFEEVTEDDVHTTLQRNFYDFIKAGNPMGEGLAFLVYKK